MRPSPTRSVQPSRTAACATLVSAVRTKRAQRKATVTVPGGDLVVEWRDDEHVILTGPAEYEFSGELDPVTPPQFGGEIARTLANSRQLTIPYAGHSRAGLEGIECVANAMTTFVERADFSGVDAACATSVKRRGFALVR